MQTRNTTKGLMSFEPITTPCPEVVDGPVLALKAKAERDQGQNQNRGAVAENDLRCGKLTLEKLQDDREHAADNRQAKGDADAVALDVLGGHCADLCSNRRANQHDQGGDQLGAALEGVGGCAVQTGDSHLEEVGADSHVGRAANQVFMFHVPLIIAG